MKLFQQMGTHDADGNIYPEVQRKLKTVEQGAATTVWCATSPRLDAVGGVYCEDCNIAEPKPATDPGFTGVRAWAIDPEAAKRLWTLSEKMLGETFDV